MREWLRQWVNDYDVPLIYVGSWIVLALVLACIYR